MLGIGSEVTVLLFIPRQLDMQSFVYQNAIIVPLENYWFWRKQLTLPINDLQIVKIFSSLCSVDNKIDHIDARSGSRTVDTLIKLAPSTSDK